MKGLCPIQHPKPLAKPVTSPSNPWERVVSWGAAQHGGHGMGKGQPTQWGRRRKPSQPPINQTWSICIERTQHICHRGPCHLKIVHRGHLTSWGTWDPQGAGCLVSIEATAWVAET